MSSVMEQSTRGLQAQNDEIEQAATAVTEMSAAVDEVAGNAVSSAEASKASDEDSKHGHFCVRLRARGSVGRPMLCVWRVVGTKITPR